MQNTPGNENRAQASQIDFLNAMILIVFTIGAFFVGSLALFGQPPADGGDLYAVATSADDRLVDDMLVKEPSDAQLNRECVDNYFNRTEDTDCAITGFNSTAAAQSEEAWLRYSLAIPESVGVNVTITESGVIQSSTNSSVTYALGPTPPLSRSVVSTARYVPLDNASVSTLKIRVWTDSRGRDNE